MAGSAPSSLSTTLAVLRPTPGRASSAPRSSGTSPSCASTRMRAAAITFLALVRYSPIERIASVSPSSPSASILAGVSTEANSGRVARLTPLSVAWAESATATTRV